MRTGSEPITARSPLRMRFWLSVWGLIWAVGGTTAFALAGRTGWAAFCGALALIVAVDMIMIVRHIRQGPHFQPGRDVPPYEPDHGGTGGYRPPPRKPDEGGGGLDGLRRPGDSDTSQGPGGGPERGP
ncbi:DUF6343 family protein [Streptomyces sp. HNM0663]|uniref:DUF6343 family protein n=1 Tax=Streptomyces chengmaiensis TaxID=3040919 RepID=A0ABT6HMQ4_9ACTN|nr:DUF6343 family protein [Streptomyces chengmaiensis]MDH2390013.1 DUF6343 family protein [Streptomyces chengmaiensis]